MMLKEKQPQIDPFMSRIVMVTFQRCCTRFDGKHFDTSPA